VPNACLVIVHRQFTNVAAGRLIYNLTGCGLEDHNLVISLSQIARSEWCTSSPHSHSHDILMVVVLLLLNTVFISKCSSLCLSGIGMVVLLPCGNWRRKSTAFHREEVTYFSKFRKHPHDFSPQAHKLSKNDLSSTTACLPYICFLYSCVHCRYWFITHPMLIYCDQTSTYIAKLLIIRNHGRISSFFSLFVLFHPFIFHPSSVFKTHVNIPTDLESYERFTYLKRV